MDTLARMNLRFADDESERAFKAYYVESYIAQMQAFLLIGCFIFFIFFLWDEMVSPAQAHVGKIIRFYIVCPTIAAVATALWWRPLRRFVEPVVCIAPLSALVGVVAIFDLLDAYAHSAAAILLLEMFCFVTLRVRFPYFAALVVATLVVYDTGHLLARTTSPTLFLINNMFVLAASTLGLFATFVQERAHRAQYLNMQLLAEARTAAERADRAKGRFIATASHDLRQPVHALGLYVHALRDMPVEPRVAHIHGQIGAALRMVEDMFEGLLDLTRLTGGGVKASVATISLRPVFAELQLLFDATASARGLRLRVRLPDLCVRSDPALLKQMLQNLAANAIRYTDRGGVLLGARRKGHEVRIEVWDTGCGIPADKLDAVFDEFVRLDRRRSGDGGLGIGLAIVKESAKILGHRVAVRSRLGKGSCFTIHLPAAADEATRPPPAARAAEPHGTERLDHFIVVVDDDPGVLEATGLLLREWGCAVLLARGAGDACRQLGEHDRSPDLVVTDYELVDEAGPDVVAAIRDAVGAPVPAIVVTGRITTEAAQRIADAGLAWHAKPLSAEKLRDIITSLSAAHLDDAVAESISPMPARCRRA
jgi:signal transduction histidine kinase/CheY-like chemotaxis protein